MNICDYGCGNIAIKQFKNKKYCCCESVNLCPAKRIADSLKKKGINPWEGREHPKGMKGKKGSNATLKAIQLGLPIPPGPNLGKPSPFKGKHRSEEFKLNRSKEMKKRYASGWESTAGRCKKYQYVSPIAGTVLVDGKWELIVCQYLDLIQVKWNRNKKRFAYINLEQKNSTYCPDFYVEDWDCFLEIKGYETDLDKCKWSQFTKKLQIWKKEKIDELKIFITNKEVSQ
jgi:hypothetical protein